jgi:hypothetical protein
MGDKKPSIRTLPGGDKVMHYPDGTQVMQPCNRLGAALIKAEEGHAAANDELTDRRLQAVADKVEAQRGGRPVPADKSVL